MTISVLAVLGLSPGPIYNCLRGMVQAGTTPDKFTLLIPARNEGPLPETVVMALEEIFSETEFVCVHLPSLDVPFKEMAQKIQSLELNPTHFLILTGTKQQVCSIQCVLPPGVIPLNLSGSENHSVVELLSVYGNQTLFKLTAAPIDEVLKIYGMEKTRGKEEETIDMGKYNKFDSKSVTMDIEEYLIPEGRLSGENTKVRCTSLHPDAKCILHVTYAWCKDRNDKKAWWSFVLNESGKIRKQLGQRAVFFCASGVDDPSQKQRLKDFGWRVT
mgnify:FL=1